MIKTRARTIFCVTITYFVQYTILCTSRLPLNDDNIMSLKKNNNEVKITPHANVKQHKCLHVSCIHDISIKKNYRFV